MEEAYIQAKELVTKKYSRNYKYFSLLTLALTAIIYKYRDYDEIIANWFNSIKLYIEADNVSNIIKKHHISNNEATEGINCNKGMYVYSSAISFCGCSVDYDADEDEINVTVENPKIVLDTTNNKTIVLNNLIHELNHSVKSIVNGIDSCEEESSVSFRSGIQIFKYTFNKEERCKTTDIYFCMFDEVINVLETTEMTESLLMLDGIIPDEDVKRDFDELDKELMSEDIGYEMSVKELRPLWSNDNFRNLIEDNIFIGNLYEIVTSFDTLLGEDAFENFAILLDDYDDEIMSNGNSKKSKRIRNKIRNVVNLYNNLTNYVYKK